MPIHIDTKTGFINPGPRLPEVHGEIVEKLIDGDWCRFSTEDGKRAFYAIGFETFLEYEKQEKDFRILQRPETGQGGAEGEWYARGQIASKHPNYLDQHKRRFEEKTGVPLSAMADWFSKWGRGEAALQDQPQSDRVSPIRMTELFCERVEALLASYREEGRQLVADDEEDRRRIDVGREKHCLREISKKYAKMVNRLEQLERISFHDAQLEEASRCYLYGFHRASIALSASAQEAHLKRVTGREYVEHYADLIKEALRMGIIDNSLAEAAGSVFKKRNEVVHKNHDPSHDEAKEILALAKGVVSALLSHN